MKRKNYTSLVLLTVLLATTLVTPAAAPLHTFHTSLMQMEYNPAEKLAEISIEVFTNDLENILSRRSGKRVRLGKTPDAAELTLAYLNETVNLKTKDGRIKTLSWVGMESKADAVRLFVETQMPDGFEGMQVRNRIFFDLLNDQINLVHIKSVERKSDLVFKHGDDFKDAFSYKPRKNAR